MRAAILTENRPELEIADVDAPRPMDGEVLLEVTACGICGSDLHVISAIADPGTIMGHEIAGTVVDAGHGDIATRWSPGDRVVARPFDGCGSCRHCLRGRADHCARFGLVGFQRPGGFAELVTVPGDELFSAPARVTGAEQSLVEPLAVARRALRRVEFAAGERLAILGGGPVGMATLLWARALGAAEVVVSEPDESRRDLARRLGADAAVAPEEIGGATLDAHGVPPPVVIECSGRPGVIDSAMLLADIEGRVGVVGICMAEDTFLPWWGLSKELDVRFSVYYGREDFIDTVDALSEGSLDPAGLVTETVDFDALPARFSEIATAPTGGKVVFVP